MDRIRLEIIEWYRTNHRLLPWRETNDPYEIWISEIILQQTRVNQGLEYYHRFLEQFPDIFALAEADEDEVLKVWQGLGYYSRARNMHHTARWIVEESRIANTKNSKQSTWAVLQLDNQHEDARNIVRFHHQLLRFFVLFLQYHLF